MPAVKTTILLVDDDRDIQDALSDCLREEDYEVHQAENGKAAWNMLEFGLRPTVILLDLMMPILNGFEFLEILRTRVDWAKIPVIVISAAGDYDASELPGVAAAFRKPLDFVALCDAIKLALRRHSVGPA